MKNNQKGFVTQLLIVIIAVLIIGGGIYYFYDKQINNSSVVPTSVMNVTQTSQPVDTSTVNTPIVSPQSSNTLTYNSSSIPFQSADFSFTYPSDWQVSDQSSNGARLTKGTSKIVITLSNDDSSVEPSSFGTKTASKMLGDFSYNVYVRTLTGKYAGIVSESYVATSNYSDRKTIDFDISSNSQQDIPVLERIIASFKLIPVTKLLIN